MSIIYLMIACTFLLVLCFILIFYLANKMDQFDDLITPAYRALMNDKEVQQEDNKGKEYE